MTPNQETPKEAADKYCCTEYEKLDQKLDLDVCILKSSTRNKAFLAGAQWRDKNPPEKWLKLVEALELISAGCGKPLEQGCRQDTYSALIRMAELALAAFRESGKEKV